MLLLDGNDDIQKKFYDLFNYFVNSENLFYYIKEVFSNDIYMQSKGESDIINVKNNIVRKNFIVSLLKFIQNLAKGKDLQTYLREQVKNRISYNFVFILVDYINMLLSKMVVLDEHTELDEEMIHLYYPRLIASIEAIYELLQGPCTKNQEALVNTKIIEIFDKILREIIFESKYKTADNNQNQNLDQQKETSKLFHCLNNYEKSMLIYKIGLILLAIIEGRQQKDEVTKKILRDFDYKIIYEKLGEIYKMIKETYGSDEDSEFFLFSIGTEQNMDELGDKIVVEAGFNLYIFLRSLLSLEDNESEFYRLFRENSEGLVGDSEMENEYTIIKNAMNYYKINTMNIEVLKDNKVQRVYFPKLNYFKNLNDKLIKEFKENADRTSIQTKLNAFLAEKDVIYEKIKLVYFVELLFKKLSFFKWLFMYPNFYKKCSLFLCILMNISILFSFTKDGLHDPGFPIEESFIYNVKFYLALDYQGICLINLT